MIIHIIEGGKKVEEKKRGEKETQKEKKNMTDAVTECQELSNPRKQTASVFKLNFNFRRYGTSIPFRRRRDD